jgi:hypothetical protein
LLVAYVSTCLWLWRARLNSEALAPGHAHSRRRGWVWGGWVVPIVLFWFPFNVIGDIAAATRNPERRDGPSTRALGRWWALWLGYLVTGQVNSRLVPWNGIPSPSAARALVPVEILNATLAVLALACWIPMIRGVHRSQGRAAAALVPQPVEGSPSPAPARAGAAWMLIVIPVLFAATCVVVGGILVAGAYEAVNDPTMSDADQSGERSSVNQGATSTYIEDLAEGDCLTTSLTGSVVPQAVDVVPCEKRHAHEVYAASDLPAGPFPGEQSVARQARQVCKTEFRDFVGISLDRSVLDVIYMYPMDAQQWSHNRSVICVTSGAGPTNHSYANTRH